MRCEILTLAVPSGCKLDNQYHCCDTYETHGRDMDPTAQTNATFESWNCDTPFDPGSKVTSTNGCGNYTAQGQPGLSNIATRALRQLVNLSTRDYPSTYLALEKCSSPTSKTNSWCGGTARFLRISMPRIPTAPLRSKNTIMGHLHTAFKRLRSLSLMIPSLPLPALKRFCITLLRAHLLP